jgi:predicted PurR-regulated permease PerM
VEYYLRHLSASRGRFETVLLYDPENITAYFGLQYFRERNSSIRCAVFQLSALFLLVALGAVLFFALNSSLSGRISSLAESLSETEDSLRRELTRLERFVEEDAASRISAEKRNADKLQELAAKIEQSSGDGEAVHRSTHTQIENLHNVIMWQNELQTSLKMLIENVLSEIQNLKVDVYRFRR